MLDDKEESAQGIRPRKSRLRRNPLTTLPGLISEAGRIYRQMKTGKLDHEKGRSLMWSLSQIRPMLEAQELEKIGARLEELSAHAEQRYGHLGQGNGRRPVRLRDGLEDG